MYKTFLISPCELKEENDFAQLNAFRTFQRKKYIQLNIQDIFGCLPL